MVIQLNVWHDRIPLERVLGLPPGLEMSGFCFLYLWKVFHRCQSPAVPEYHRIPHPLEYEAENERANSSDLLPLGVDLVYGDLVRDCVNASIRRLRLCLEMTGGVFVGTSVLRGT